MPANAAWTLFSTIYILRGIRQLNVTYGPSEILTRHQRTRLQNDLSTPGVVYSTTIFISDQEFRNKHGDSDSEERQRRKVLIFWKCVFRATGDFIFFKFLRQAQRWCACLGEEEGNLGGAGKGGEREGKGGEPGWDFRGALLIFNSDPVYMLHYLLFVYLFI